MGRTPRGSILRLQILCHEAVPVLARGFCYQVGINIRLKPPLCPCSTPRTTFERRQCRPSGTHPFRTANSFSSFAHESAQFGPLLLKVRLVSDDAADVWCHVKSDELQGAIKNRRLQVRYWLNRRCIWSGNGVERKGKVHAINDCRARSGRCKALLEVMDRLCLIERVEYRSRLLPKRSNMARQR